MHSSTLTTRPLVRAISTRPGLRPRKGERSGGLGLANVRERLAVLYDGQAELILEERTPCGTRATIKLPNHG